MPVLTNVSRHTILADQAQLATRPLTRMVGLLNRRMFQGGQALIFPRCSAIHTCFMRFPIDVVFLKGGTVIRLIAPLKSFRLAWALGADTVVELPAGTLEQGVVQPGDRLDWSGNVGGRQSGVRSQ